MDGLTTIEIADAVGRIEDFGDKWIGISGIFA
jgi:hypothetical protein